MAWSIAPPLSSIAFDNSSLFITTDTSTPNSSFFSSSSTVFRSTSNSKQPCILPLQKNLHFTRQLICKAAEYKFPDPIPEFAESETEKFKTHLLKKLSKKDVFGDHLEEVVGICTEIFDNFMHAEYGGPGTLLVLPFIDMADTLNERGLPGGPQAARAAVKWAQENVDKDWKEWTSGNKQTVSSK
ncbi:Protein PLASTID REDOX INSENSITIVE 2 chloroplastic [Bienertia sinuspersici]